MSDVKLIFLSKLNLNFEPLFEGDNGDGVGGCALISFIFNSTHVLLIFQVSS